METATCVKYLYLVCFIISSFKCRTSRYCRDRMRVRRSNQDNTMIILLVDSQVRVMRDNGPSACRRRCRTGRVIAGRLESIAEGMCVTRIRVVVLLTIGALVTLGRFGFPTSNRVGFPCILLLVVELVDLMRASVESFTIRAKVSGTRKLHETTGNINISNRVLRLKVVNDIVHGRRKSHEKVACFGFIGLKILKEMAIG